WRARATRSIMRGNSGEGNYGASSRMTSARTANGAHESVAGPRSRSQLGAGAPRARSTHLSSSSVSFLTTEKESGMDTSSHLDRRSVGLTRGAAMTFVILLGLVSLFADVTYEGARSITGPYLAVLGASATVVGVVAGFGELIGYVLRLVAGYLSD